MGEEREFTLPPLVQIGIVVRDVQKAVEYYTRVFGIGPWEIRDISLGPERCWVRGKPFTIKSHPDAFAQLGPIQIELVQPPEDGIHRWFLDEKGEGLHHLCFRVDNYDAWMDHLKQQGIEILMNVVFDHPEGPMRAAYVESDKTGGVLFEFIESQPEKK
jgi:catechol 2,3-dioxygenase-like lactoylglutathione lyase family enzyme